MARPLLPAHIAELVPYQPGKPAEETRRELGLERVIKLASNENPLGPSPRALEAATRALGQINRYPDGGCYYLKQGIARHLGVDPGQILVGNGSNEVIELIVRTFVDVDDEVVASRESFIVYELATRAHGRRLVTVPMRDHHYDVSALAGAVGERTRALFLANPNNPTGTWIDRDSLTALARELPERCLLVVDEAYFEYADHPDYPDSLALHQIHPNTLTLRTFSKVYGLAGLRCGYAVTRPELVTGMNRVRAPFNVNSVAQAACLAALEDRDHLERSRRLNLEERGRLRRALESLGLAVAPSQTNFLLVELERDGVETFQRLLRLGVTVRPLVPYGLPTSVRITVGTPEENDLLLEALEQLLGQG